MVRKVRGIAEVVDDVRAAAAFYRDVLGLEVEEEDDGSRATVRVPGDLRFEVWSRERAAGSLLGEPREGPAIPLGFTVALEMATIQSAAELAASKGWQLLEPRQGQPEKGAGVTVRSASGGLVRLSPPAAAQAASRTRLRLTASLAGARRFFNRLRTHSFLLARSLARDPLVVLLLYCLLLAALCVIGSKTFWRDYLPYQLPGLLVHDLGAAVAAVSAVAVPVLWRLWPQPPIQAKLQDYVRSGLVGGVLAGCCAALWIAALSWPTPKDRIVDLLTNPRKLRSTAREDVQDAKMDWEKFNNTPKYKDRPEAKLIEDILACRIPLQFPAELADAVIRDAEIYLAPTWQRQQPIVRYWAIYLKSIAYYYGEGDADNARANFELLANDPKAPADFRAFACYISGFIQSDTLDAKVDRSRTTYTDPRWRGALKAIEQLYRSAIGLGWQDFDCHAQLGLVLSRESKFSDSSAEFSAAERIANGPSRVGRQQQSIMYANWADILRAWASTTKGTERRQHEQEAHDRCEKARQLWDENVVVYWTEVVTDLGRSPVGTRRSADEMAADRADLAECRRQIEKIEGPAGSANPYRQYRFFPYAKSYNAWLEVRTVFREGARLRDYTDIKRRFVKALGIGRFSAADVGASVTRLMDNLRRTELSLHGEREDLTAMKRDGFFAE